MTLNSSPKKKSQTEALNRDPKQDHFGAGFRAGSLGQANQGKLSGMTTNGYCEKVRFRHSDKAPGRNLDATASLL